MEADLETKLRRAEERHEDENKDYYDKVVQRDKRIDELKEKVEKLEKERNEWKQEQTEFWKEMKTLRETAQKLDTANERIADLEMHKKADKKSHGLNADMLASKDKEIERQRQRTIQMFQDKKKAEKELAEQIATTQGLHKELDELEKTIANKDRELNKHAENDQYINDLHSQLEETFTEFKGGNLSTPELLERIKERENSMLRRSDSRSSTTSKSDGKHGKKARKSVGDELADAELWGEEEGENDEDEDVTLTEPIEVTELRQKLREVENELEDAKTKQGSYLARIGELNRDAETKSKAFEEDLSTRDAALEKKSKEINEKRDELAAKTEELRNKSRALEESSKELEENRRTLEDSKNKLKEKSRELDDSKKKTTTKPEKLGLSTTSSVATEPEAPTPPTANTKKPQEQQLGQSDIIFVETAPVAPAPPSTTTTNTITNQVHIQPERSIRACWNATPTWLVWVLVILLVLFLYFSNEVRAERDLWLRANASAPRVFKITNLAGSRRYSSAWDFGLGWRLLRNDLVGWYEGLSG